MATKAEIVSDPWCLEILEVCSDCSAYMVDPDGGHFAFYYGEDDTRYRAVEAAWDATIPPRAWVEPLPRPEFGEDHSIYACQCCGSSAHGERYSAVIWLPPNMR